MNTTNFTYDLYLELYYIDKRIKEIQQLLPYEVKLIRENPDDSLDFIDTLKFVSRGSIPSFNDENELSYKLQQQLDLPVTAPNEYYVLQDSAIHYFIRPATYIKWSIGTDKYHDTVYPVASSIARTKAENEPLTKEQFDNLFKAAGD